MTETNTPHTRAAGWDRLGRRREQSVWLGWRLVIEINGTSMIRDRHPAMPSRARSCRPKYDEPSDQLTTEEMRTTTPHQPQERERGEQATACGEGVAGYGPINRQQRGRVRVRLPCWPSPSPPIVVSPNSPAYLPVVCLPSCWCLAAPRAALACGIGAKGGGAAVTGGVWEGGTCGWRRRQGKRFLKNQGTTAGRLPTRPSYVTYGWQPNKGDHGRKPKGGITKAHCGGRSEKPFCCYY
jgi:hypothetical protein